MFGPMVLVALREPLTDEQVDELFAWLLHIAVRAWPLTSISLYDGDKAWGMDVSDAAMLGLTGVDCPLSYSLEVMILRNHIGLDEDAAVAALEYRSDDPPVSDYAGDKKERDQWIAWVGFFPHQVVELAVAGNSEPEHRLLGHLALTTHCRTLQRHHQPPREVVSANGPERAA